MRFQYLTVCEAQLNNSTDLYPCLIEKFQRQIAIFENREPDQAQVRKELADKFKQLIFNFNNQTRNETDDEDDDTSDDDVVVTRLFHQ